MARAQPVLSPAAQQDAVQRGHDRVEKHIVALHARLMITQAQEPHWSAFAAIMRANARRLEQAWLQNQSQTPTMNAIADLKAYAALERARVEDVERLIPPFEDLYKTFSPEQRTIADKTFHNFQRPHHPGT